LLMEFRSLFHAARDRPACACENRPFLTSALFRFPGGLTFSLGPGHPAQFSFAHRFVHALGRASERRLLAFASLGSQCCACGHLLFL
jgi:hypothetical protein